MSIKKIDSSPTTELDKIIKTQIKNAEAILEVLKTKMQ